jgi:hypothetical protein
VLRLIPDALAIYARAAAEADRKAADAVGEQFRPRDPRAMEPQERPAADATESQNDTLTSTDVQCPQRDSNPCCRLERAERPWFVTFGVDAKPLVEAHICLPLEPTQDTTYHLLRARIAHGAKRTLATGVAGKFDREGLGPKGCRRLATDLSGHRRTLPRHE